MDRVLPGAPIPRGEIGAGNRDWTARTYWNAVAYNDRLIGALIARLRRLGVLDNTLVVVTADHGESLFDDGFLGHGHMLNEQQTRIPFILSAPGVAMPPVIGLADMRAHHPARGGRADARAGAAPAVFQYLGVARPARLDRHGRSRPATGRSSASTRNRSGPAATGRWTRYADLAAGSAEKRAADALIDEWARQRWLRHLREQPAAR